MYEALINFYKYGFIIFKKVPTENNFIINFANSIVVFEGLISVNFSMLNRNQIQMI